MGLKIGQLSRFRFEFILLGILIFGAFLRFDDLTKESLWFDEIFTVNFVTSGDFFQVLKNNVEQEPQHPPLYYSFMHFWVKLFGDSDFSVRFPSAIFGILAIFMLYKVGSLIFDKNTALLGSLILSVSHYHIYYSQEARAYSLLSFLTLVSFYFFIKLLDRLSIGTAIGHVLSNALLMYVHLYGSFVIIAQNIYIITLFIVSKEISKSFLKNWIFLQAILVLLFLPWGIVLIEQNDDREMASGHFTKVTWIQDPNLETIVNTFKAFSGPYYPVRGYNGQYNLFLPFLLLLAFSIIPSEFNTGKLSHNKAIFLLFSWLLAPILLPYVISKILAPIYSVRYAGSVALALYLFVAKGIRDINQMHLRIIVLCLVIGISLLHIIDSRNAGQKDQWRDAANDVDSHAEPGDLVLFTGLGAQLGFDRYSKRTDLVKMPFDDNSIEKRDKVWVLQGVYGEISNKLYDSYSESYNKSYMSTQIHLFKKNEEGAK